MNYLGSIKSSKIKFLFKTNKKLHEAIITFSAASNI